MTPIEQRNALVAERLVKALERRNISADYCPTAAEAVRRVSDMIADGSSVSWGGSMTIRDMGLTEALHRRKDLRIIDRDGASTPDAIRQAYLDALAADVFLTSANAISEDGEIVNIDGNGNRVAAISWGPKKVIFIIGMNKVMPTLDAAIARARGIAAPVNAMRFDIKTPCHADGVCHDCFSPESICSMIHVLRNGRSRGRFAVVLVGEQLGY